MGTLKRFRRVCEVNEKCNDGYNTDFISSSASSTIITVVRTGNEEKAVLIMSDTMGPDNPEVFVHSTTDLNSHEYFTWKDIYFFTIEQNHIVTSNLYHKFKCLECNCLINDEIPAFFAGPMKATKLLSINSENATSIDMNPVIALPFSDKIKIGDSIKIKEQTWNIYGGDLYTLEGIAFYYIERGVNSAEIEPVIPEEENYVGENLSVTTENGIFSTNIDVKIIRRTSSVVDFIPLVAGELVITTANEVITMNIKEVY